MGTLARTVVVSYDSMARITSSTARSPSSGVKMISSCLVPRNSDTTRAALQSGESGEVPMEKVRISVSGGRIFFAMATTKLLSRPPDKRKPMLLSVFSTRTLTDLSRAHCVLTRQNAFRTVCCCATHLYLADGLVKPLKNLPVAGVPATEEVHGRVVHVPGWKHVNLASELHEGFHLGRERDATCI